MQIVIKSIAIIDYENNRVLPRNTPESFNEYVSELVTHINGNNSIREYKSRSNTTEVIGSIIAICSNQNSHEFVESKMEGIAKRLLLKEIEAQELISRTKTNVQKGSLIQALLVHGNPSETSYLLAKVEHSDWVDDADFKFKTGFSKDKKTLWKSCLIDLSNLAASEFHARIYSNTVAKYWSHDFLEFDEMNSDEKNTIQAFKAIDSTINQNFRGTYSPDKTIIRNAFVLYLKSNEHIDYPVMVNTILENYEPTDPDITKEKVNTLREKLLEQPTTKNFDNQFNSIRSVIDARIRRVYNVYDGIDLRVTKEIDDLSQTIQSVEIDGKRYLQIRTNNDSTYKQFLY